MYFFRYNKYPYLLFYPKNLYPKFYLAFQLYSISIYNRYTKTIISKSTCEFFFKSQFYNQVKFDDNKIKFLICINIGIW